MTTSAGSMAAPASPTVVAIMAPPMGHVLNFENPQRKGDIEGYWVVGSGVILGFMVLSLRVYIRAFVARSFVLADGAFSICGSMAPRLTI